MTITLLILLAVSAFVGWKFLRAPSNPSLADKMYATTNAVAKLKGNVDMFRAGISPERLRRDANKSDLEYYIGYITALARHIAETDGIPPDGVILSTVQIEASRLFGSSSEQNGSYAEGIELLPTVLATNAANIGVRDGDIDGSYVVDPNNPGPYFDRLRQRFDVQLPKS